jgi:hypothetical protein
MNGRHPDTFSTYFYSLPGWRADPAMYIGSSASEATPSRKTKRDNEDLTGSSQSVHTAFRA